MPLFKTIHPLGSCTLEHDDKIIAAVGVLAAGQAEVGLEDESGGTVLPVLALNHDAAIQMWMRDVGISNGYESDGASRRLISEFIDANKDEIAKALDSCMVGSFERRRAFMESIDRVSVATREPMSSASGICLACWGFAAMLRRGR